MFDSLKHKVVSGPVGEKDISIDVYILIKKQGDRP